jgi:hypothetical protein
VGHGLNIYTIPRGVSPWDNQTTRQQNPVVTLIFAGNPLNCDCFVRPLKRYLDGELFVGALYKSIKCAGPPYLSGQTLFELPDDRLNCPTNVNTSRIMETQPGEYDITPDLRFRELSL